MPTTSPTKHNSLNPKQIHILKMAYKFRFLNAPLLAEYKDLKSRHSMYMTLELLAKQGYLLRRRDDTPFNNKGIRYGLTSKAFKVLKAESVTSEALKPLYRNKDVLEDFVDHQVAVLKVFLAIRDQETFHMFCRTELHDFEDFPTPKPDIFMRRRKQLKTKPNMYFIELWHDQPLFITKKRLKALVAHYDTEWPDSDYPTLLFVLANERTAKSFQKYADNLLEDLGMDEEIEVQTFTIDKLLECAVSLT